MEEMLKKNFKLFPNHFNLFDLFFNLKFFYKLKLEIFFEISYYESLMIKS
jgi:hypothetical protein